MSNLSKQAFLTWTGEDIFYDDVLHAYTTEDGTPMVSGSAYAEQHLPAFNADRAAEYVAKKHKALKADILAMWARNGEISRTFGTAFHLAMEQWFLSREKGTSREYHLPKIKYLRDAVATFPLRNADIKPEVLVSDTKALRAGRLDALHHARPGVYEIIDFKTDSNVEKNLAHHELQLNFYRAILEGKGYPVCGMTIWAYDGAWSSYSLKKIEIK